MIAVPLPKPTIVRFQSFNYTNENLNRPAIRIIYGNKSDIFVGITPEEKIKEAFPMFNFRCHISIGNNLCVVKRDGAMKKLKLMLNTESTFSLDGDCLDP